MVREWKDQGDTLYVSDNSGKDDVHVGDDFDWYGIRAGYIYICLCEGSARERGC